MPEIYIQEACLGRARMRAGRDPVCYLIKWQGYAEARPRTVEAPVGGGAGRGGAGRGEGPREDPEIRILAFSFSANKETSGLLCLCLRCQPPNRFPISQKGPFAWRWFLGQIITIFQTHPRRIPIFSNTPIQ